MARRCFFTKLLMTFTYVLSLVSHGEAQLQIASACYAVTGCNTFSLSCTGNDVLRVVSLQYGIKTNTCNDKRNKCNRLGGCCYYSEFDCFQNFTQLHAQSVTSDCNGKLECGPLQAPFNLMSSCINQPSTYVVIRYECVVDVINSPVQTSIITTTTRNDPATSSTPVTSRSTIVSASLPITVLSATTASTAATSTVSTQFLKNDPDDDNTAVIVVSILVPAAVLCIIAVVVGCLLRRRRQKQQIPKQTPESTGNVYSEIELGSSSRSQAHDGPMYDDVYESRTSHAQAVSSPRAMANGNYQTDLQNYDQVYEPGRLNRAQDGANATPLDELETHPRVPTVATNIKAHGGSVWYRKSLAFCRKKVTDMASALAKRFPKPTAWQQRGTSSENAQETEMTQRTIDADHRNADSRPNSSEQFAVNLGNSYIEFHPRLEPGDEQVQFDNNPRMLQLPKRPPPFPKQKNVILPVPVQMTQASGGAAVVRYDYDTVPDPEYGHEFQISSNTTLDDENQVVGAGGVSKEAVNDRQFTGNLPLAQESEAIENEGSLYDMAYDGFEDKGDEMTHTETESKSGDRIIYDCHGYLVPRSPRLNNAKPGNCADKDEKNEFDIMKEKRKSQPDKEIWSLPSGKILNKSKSDSCIIDTRDGDAKHNGVKFVRSGTIVKSDNSTPKNYESSDIGRAIAVKDMARCFEQKK